MNHNANAAERLTVSLHDLIRNGKGDDAEADEIREKLIEALVTLPAEQRQILNDLSGDLFLLSSEERLVSEGQHSAIELKHAWAARDWHRLRALLVYDIPSVTVHYRAYLRGRAWGELGYHRASAEFLFFAWEMRPETDNYGYLAIEALLDSGSFQEAWERAARIAVGAKASATLLYKVADVLYIGAHRCDPGFQPRLYERVIEVVDKASRLPQPSVTSVQVAGLVKKGFALANLGDLDKAEATLTEALKGDNNNDILLSARGLVRIESGRTSEALLDLMRAVDKGTVQSWPFVYVAQHAIQNGEFTRALDLVEEALRRTNDPRLQANLVEWRAIVLSGLGRMDEAVQFASEAETIEPFNERIAQNLQLIRSAQPYHRLQLQVDYSPAEMRLAG